MTERAARAVHNLRVKTMRPMPDTSARPPVSGVLGPVLDELRARYPDLDARIVAARAGHGSPTLRFLAPCIACGELAPVADGQDVAVCNDACRRARRLFLRRRERLTRQEKIA